MTGTPVEGPASTVTALQNAGTMDDLIAYLMHGQLTQNFQQQAAPQGSGMSELANEFSEHSDLAPDQVYNGPPAPAITQQPAAAEEPQKKDERSFLGRAWDAVTDGAMGGVGAMGGLLVGNLINGNSNGIKDYLKVGAVNAASNAVQSYVTDREQGGLTEGVIAGLTTSAVEKLSGNDGISIPESLVGAATGVLGGWLKRKAMSFLGFGKEEPAPAARQQQPTPN